MSTPRTRPPSPDPVVGLVGNPVPGSRTSTVTDLVVDAVRAALSVDAAETIELADHRGDVFGEGPGLVSAQQQVADARVLVVATPAYKGSYTGLLKLFLDGLPAGSLAGTVVVPVVVAGSPVHATMTDVHLRWVLGELGGSLPVPSVVLTERQLDAVDEVVASWSHSHLPAVCAVAGVRAGELTVAGAR